MLLHLLVSASIVTSQIPYSCDPDCDVVCSWAPCRSGLGECTLGGCQCFFCKHGENMTISHDDLKTIRNDVKAIVETTMKKPAVTCQYGGLAACNAHCLLEGYNCGFCRGTEPNEVCVCEHCKDTDVKTPELSCQVLGRSGCITSCKVQGCRTGYCVGTAPNEICQCSGCGK